MRMMTVIKVDSRDVFEDNMVEAEDKARDLEAKAKAKATEFCPRGVLEVEASPRGPHPLGFLPRDATP